MHQFYPLYYVMTMTHYFAGFYYSGKNFLRIFHNFYYRLAFLFLGIVGFVVIYYQSPSIVYFFGLHHIATEIYSFKEFYPEIKQNRGLLIWRLLANAFGYVFWFRFIILNPYEEQAFRAQSSVIYAITLCFYTGLLIYITRLKTEPESSGFKRDLFLFEMVNFIVLSTAWRISYDFNFIVFYHGIIWLYLYTYKTWLKKSGFTRFALSNLIGTVFFGATFVWMKADPHFSYQSLAHLIIIWGYLHIFATYMTSSYNPRFVSRWFSPS